MESETGEPLSVSACSLLLSVLVVTQAIGCRDQLQQALATHGGLAKTRAVGIVYSKAPMRGLEPGTHK